MKYKLYVLKLGGDPGIVHWINRNMIQPKTLGECRAAGRAAQTLFGVSFEVETRTLAKPVPDGQSST